MRCLSADQFLWRHNLHTVQALVLLIYAISHSSGPSWALLGTTFHICVSLGMHVDPSELNLNPVRSEQRRRCWAGLMLLYTIQSATLGNLAPVKLTSAATVRLPSELDDEDISPHGPLCRPSDAAGHLAPTKISYILFKFKLYIVASDVCQFARGRKDWSTLLELEHRISAEEHEHETRFSDVQQLPTYHLAHQYILNSYIHHLRLTLYRPYVLGHGTGQNRGAAYTREQVQQSRAHCLNSAMSLLGNHEDLFHDPRFKPYRWFVYSLGSFQSFLAASTLIVLLDSEEDVTVPHRAHFRQALEKCLGRFESMAVRSDVCFKSAAILRRMLCSPQIRHRGLEPPGLLYQASSTSDESEKCSIQNGRTASGHPTPMIHPTQPGLGFETEPNKMDTSWYSCPPQIYDLLDLPPEQWLGGAGALSWDWTGWLDPTDPRMDGLQTAGRDHRG